MPPTPLNPKEPYLSNKYHDEISLNTNGVPIDPITAGLFIGVKRPTVEKRINEEFWHSYQPSIVRATIYAWNLYPSIETATGLYNTINIVNKCSELGDNIKSGFENCFRKTQVEIKNKFPKWKPPKSQKECFIATATMGDYNHPYVVALRKYRDEHLIKYDIGKTIVDVYYLLSPPIARYIENSLFLRTVTFYFVVEPSFLFVKYFYKEILSKK